MKNKIIEKMQLKNYKKYRAYIFYYQFILIRVKAIFIFLRVYKNAQTIFQKNKKIFLLKTWIKIFKNFSNMLMTHF